MFLLHWLHYLIHVYVYIGYRVFVIAINREVTHKTTTCEFVILSSIPAGYSEMYHASIMWNWAVNNVWGNHICTFTKIYIWLQLWKQLYFVFYSLMISNMSACQAFWSGHRNPLDPLWLVFQTLAVHLIFRLPCLVAFVIYDDRSFTLFWHISLLLNSYCSCSQCNNWNAF